MKDFLEVYLKARTNLYKYLGYDGYPELIEDKTKDEWYYNGEGVNWIEDEDEYSVDSAELLGEADGYILYNIYDNGREYHMLLHRDNEVTDEDEIEKKFDY